MRQGAKLLIVDDEASFVRSVSDHLSLCGYQVFVAFDGNQALLQMEKEHPALALLDLKMPGPNGEELIRRAQQVSPETKLVILTAFHDSGVREAALRQAGVVGFLYKPLPSLLELERLIETTLGEKS